MDRCKHEILAHANQRQIDYQNMKGNSQASFVFFIIMHEYIISSLFENWQLVIEAAEIMKKINKNMVLHLIITSKWYLDM